MSVLHPAEPAEPAGPTLAPGSLQRVRQMAALRETGCSLEEIAARFEVSRERVRQILNAQGGPRRADIRQARRQRAERLAEARVDELLALWRSGAEHGEVAARLGLQVAACRGTIERFATEVDRAARRAALARMRTAPVYSDEDLVVALTSIAARLGRVPSAKEYAAARDGGLPSVPTILNRMGGWSNALAIAGLRPGAAPVGRRRRWTEGACWQALRRVADELGEVPSVLAYERLAAGRDDLPSSATIRHRLGRWSSLTARLAAERELANQTLSRARTAAGSLASA